MLITVEIVADIRRERVSIHFSREEVREQKQGELIIDISRMGNWIRGVEMEGSALTFPLRPALRSLQPVRPIIPQSQIGLTVTYDDEADAAFLFLPYGDKYTELSDQERHRHTEYSHSITPIGICGLNDEGELLTIAFSTSDVIRSMNEFLFLFNYKIEGMAGSFVEGDKSRTETN